MPEVFPIHDLYIKPILLIEEPGSTRWPTLSDSDHILRRFGLAEVVRVQPELPPKVHVREIADEVWILIEGRCEFYWHDLRENSPTYDKRYRLICDHPTLVLVPFGVAFAHRALDGAAIFLRLATHADGEHEGDRQFPLEIEA
jgi:hypothetical protein